MARPGAEHLTLEQSLERAYHSNPRLLEAQKAVSIADAQMRQARSLFYPKIDLSLNYVRYRNETLGLAPLSNNRSAILEAPIEDPKGTRANPLASNLYLGELGFLQTLYAGGRQKYTYKLAAAGRKRAESAYETLRQQVEFETKRAHLTLLALDEKKRLTRDMLVELSRRFGSTGSIPLPVERAQAKTRQALADLDLTDRNARYDFLQVLGTEMFSDVDAVGRIDDAPATVDLQAALVWAKQNRPELKATEIEERANELSIDLSMSEKYPVVTLGGGYELRDDDLPLQDQNWNAAVSMSLPIFDGFSRRAEVRQSRYRAEQGRLERVQLEDQIDREVRSAFDALGHWTDERSIRETELHQLEQSRRRYVSEGGIALSDRVQFFQWLLDAQLALVEARYQIALAKAQFERAIGRPLAAP